MNKDIGLNSIRHEQGLFSNSKYAIESKYKPWNWMIKATVHNFFNFKGRARRKEFWYMYLLNSLSFYIADKTSSMPITIFALILSIPMLAATVRRLHDIGYSGWWVLLFPLPSIALLFSIALVSSSSSILLFTIVIAVFCGPVWAFIFRVLQTKSESKGKLKLIKNIIYTTGWTALVIIPGLNGLLSLYILSKNTLFKTNKWGPPAKSLNL